MSVTVGLIGRLGNNLFQYALGRTIAERHGFALECDAVRQADHLTQDLDVREPADLSRLATHFPSAPLCLDGREVIEPIEAYELTGASWDGQTVPISEILANESSRRIRLNGYFQRFEYLEPRLEQIRCWFRVAIPAVQGFVGPDDVIVHIRRGFDYGAGGWILPFHYYNRALSMLRPAATVHICGIGIDTQIRERFAAFDPVYHDVPLFEQFKLVQTFRRIVLSNDTTAWWAAFLSNAESIIAPRAVNGSGYAFTGFSHVDLHMRQTRYLEVEVPTFERLVWRASSRMCGAAIYRSGQDLIVAAPDRKAACFKNAPATLQILKTLVQQENIASEDVAANSLPVIMNLARTGLVDLRIGYAEEAMP